MPPLEPSGLPSIGQEFTQEEDWSQPHRQRDDGTRQGGRVVYVPQFDVVTFIGNGGVIVGGCDRG